MRQRLPTAALKAREALLILEALPAGTRLIALDEHGALWSSRALAERLAAWRDQGVAELAFAIGGADGLGAAVLDRAEATLSLGPMTWPHLLVRGMLLEQLLVPGEGFEPPTFGLQNRCTATVLTRPVRLV